jgi:hypothetical protein
LIGRPVDRASKPLTKNESVPLYGLPDHARGAPISSFTETRFENSIENAEHFRAAGLVYQALTAIGKDCGGIVKRGISASMARAGSGTGEQTWL